MHLPSPVALGLSLLAYPAAAGTPVLEHTAPLLGATVTVTLSGAAPGAPVGLLYSPTSAELPTPLGTLELGPAGLRVVASGTADSAGEWSFPFAVPMNVAWAELEAHLQAIEVDAGAPGGGVLSTGSHLRFLGSRVYAQVTGTPPGDRLLAFSAVQDEDVFVVDLPGSATGGRIHVNSDYSLGAMFLDTPSPVLAIFDNFFGELLEARPVAGAIAAMHPDGDSYYVWDASANELERFSFASGALLESIAVPGGHGQPIFDEDVTTAIVGVPGTSPPAFVSVDLATGAISSPIAIGTPGDTALSLLGHTGGWVIATTRGGPGGQTFLSQVDPSAGAPSAISTDITGLGSGTLIVPEAGVVLAWEDESQDPFFWTPWEMISVPIGAAGPVESMGTPEEPPGSGVVDSYRWVVDGSGAWFTDICCQEAPDGDERGALWFLDAETAMWTPSVPDLYEGPKEVTVVDDAFGSRVFVNRDSTAPAGFGETAKLVAVDKATLDTESFEFTLTDSVWAYGLLWAIPVP